MAQRDVKVRLDLPEGVELLGYERCGDGHGFEVKFPLPEYCRCELCIRQEAATYEYKNTVYVVRDLDLWGQPSFLIFQPCFHRFLFPFLTAPAWPQERPKGSDRANPNAGLPPRQPAEDRPCVPEPSPSLWVDTGGLRCPSEHRGEGAAVGSISGHRTPGPP